MSKQCLALLDGASVPVEAARGEGALRATVEAASPRKAVELGDVGVTALQPMSKWGILTLAVVCEVEHTLELFGVGDVVLGEELFGALLAVFTARLLARLRHPA